MQPYKPEPKEDSLKDKVPSRCYYYMLDWNDQNEKKEMFDSYGKMRLADLTEVEFWSLFKYATQKDNRLFT